MTKTSILLGALLLAAATTLSAQDTKGVRPINQSTNQPVNQTRAVVVGISDYQSPQLPDLRFADRDAEAFADWLKSPAGGNMPEDNMQLFTNEKATSNAIVVALYYLLDVCKPGDQVLFYFSGHGDVEAKTRNNPGYLLTYDTPPNVYMAGALNLRDLQEIVGTLSEKQVRMVLITDACHAGKLAGNSLGGTQATAVSLAQQFANEVKIMSCQPNEMSLEGEQWGGGRGAFSYHLVDALTGLADRNNDGTVNLLEVGRYLEETVPAETAPHSQVPIVAGDRMAVLARVDAASLAARRNEKSGRVASLEATGSKGLEDEVLARADPATRAHYAGFKAALADHNLLDANDSSAETHFQYLLGQEVLAPLHGLMRRNYAVSLLDEVQQALNALLADDPYETNNWRYNPAKYTDYARQVQRAIEVLGEGHYLRRSLTAKQRYFEGYSLAHDLGNLNNDQEYRDSLQLLAKAKYLEALELEPTAPYLYYAVGSLHFRQNPPQTDSMVAYIEQAVALAPTWLTPSLDMAYEYQLSQNDLKKVEEWFSRALRVSPESYVVLERLSWLYQWVNRTEESLALCETMKKIKPDLFNAWSTAGTTRLMRKEFAEAELEFQHSIAIDSNLNNWANNGLIILFLRTRRHQEAERLLPAILNAPDVYLDYKSAALLGQQYSLLATGNYKKAKEVSEKLETMNAVASHVAVGIFSRGIVELMDGDPAKGRLLLQKGYAMDSMYTIYPVIWNTYEGILAERTGRFAQADSFFRAALALQIFPALDNRLGSFSENARYHFGAFLLRQKRYAEARAQFDQLLRDEPKGFLGYYGHALLAAARKQPEKALDYLEKALDNWYPEAEPILAEPFFKGIRKTERFEALMKKHFPDQVKD